MGTFGFNGVGAHRGRISVAFTVVGAAALALASALPAAAVGSPIDLGTASSYGVLAALSISNTGPTTINGDIGLSPGQLSSITGLSSITVTGQVHAADQEALQAQNDLGTAYTTAAGLSSTAVQQDLTGLTLTPGVYNATSSLQLSGNLTLDGAGDPNATWVFQTGSSLTAATGSSITLIGQASACNVYWQVGSSATLDTSAAFVGTVMAQQSISAGTGATVQGRLLAENGSVTLDSNVITPPTTCATAGGSGGSGSSGGSGGTGGTGGSASGGSGATGGTTSTTAPTFTTQALPPATVNRPYRAAVVVAGSPTPTVTVSSGTLPSGLALNSTTGTISGTPTSTQLTTFALTASNGSGTTATTTYRLAVLNSLASTGANATPLLAGGSILVALGIGALVFRMRARSPHGRRALRVKP